MNPIISLPRCRLECKDRYPIRVLLVDDHLQFIEAAERFLTADPNIEIVGRAVSGGDALKQVGLLHPDLVLMDLAMPEIDGLEATRRIKAQPSSPHVIILTFHDHPEYREAAKDAGADGFIAKLDFTTQLLPLVYALVP